MPCGKYSPWLTARKPPELSGWKETRSLQMLAIRCDIVTRPDVLIRHWHHYCFYGKRVSSANAERGEPVRTQANFVERRERPRLGVMTQLEDITYSILRKHGVVSGLGRQKPVIQPITR